MRRRKVETDENDAIREREVGTDETAATDVTRRREVGTDETTETDVTRRREVETAETGVMAARRRFGGLDLPAARSEVEVLAELRALAARNTVNVPMIGPSMRPMPPITVTVAGVVVMLVLALPLGLSDG